MARYRLAARLGFRGLVADEADHVARRVATYRPRLVRVIPFEPLGRERVTS